MSGRPSKDADKSKTKHNRRKSSRRKPKIVISDTEDLTSPAGDDQESKSPDRPQSPEGNCSICLGSFQNKSFTDSCFHTFCFTCLLEWSKVKAVCPLCKQAFKSIIHSVRSIEDYDQYDLRQNNVLGSENDGTFRYRTTLTQDRWLSRQQREQARQLRLLQRPSTLRTRTHWRRQRQTATSDFRRRVYAEGLRVQDELERSPGRPRRERNITPEFFSRNPACTHRLVPWLNRELNVLLHNHDDHVHFVLELIIDLIKSYEIGGEVFRTHLDSFLGRRTDHFVHEFIHYARSPYDMCTYDARAVYHVNPREVDPLSVLVLDSSSDSEDNNEEPDIIELSPTPPVVTVGSTEHSYNTNDRNIEPPPERRNRHQDVTPTPHPLIQRVHDFLRGIDNADTAHSGWESPIPGPSHLDWSPPNPRSPTMESTTDIAEIEQNGTITSIDENELQSVSVREEAGPSRPTEDSDTDDCLITGFERPFEERSPIPLSSEDDLESLISKTRGKRSKKGNEGTRRKDRRRSRTPLQYRVAQSKSKSRSPPRLPRFPPSRQRAGRSRSRDRRSRSRDQYRRSRSRQRQNSSTDNRHRRRSRSHDGRSQRSRSRERSDRRRRSRSRGSDRNLPARNGRNSGRTRSRSPLRRQSRSRSRDRRYGRRSRSIEYVGSRNGRDQRDDRRRRSTSRNRRDAVSRSSTQSRQNDRSRRSRSRDRRSRSRNRRSSSRSRRSRSRNRRSRSRHRSRSGDRSRNDASWKKHPSGHKKSSSIENGKVKIKLEPASWTINSPERLTTANIRVAGDHKVLSVCESNSPETLVSVGTIDIRSQSTANSHGVDGLMSPMSGITTASKSSVVQSTHKAAGKTQKTGESVQKQMTNGNYSSSSSTDSSSSSSSDDDSSGSDSDASSHKPAPKRNNGSAGRKKTSSMSSESTGSASEQRNAMADLFPSDMDLKELEKEMREKLTSRLKKGNNDSKHKDNTLRTKESDSRQKHSDSSRRRDNDSRHQDSASRQQKNDVRSKDSGSSRSRQSESRHKDNDSRSRNSDSRHRSNNDDSRHRHTDNEPRHKNSDSRNRDGSSRNRDDSRYRDNDSRNRDSRSRK